MPISSTNLKNRVNKLHLPKTKPLYPLFEVISNAIHAIDEKKTKYKTKYIGKILINTIRNGNQAILFEIADIEKYPIISFEIIDNGIGLNEENYNSFQEFDSEHKASIGGKGIGRLLCLKAFQKMIVASVYRENDKMFLRNFEYKKSKEGFDNYEGGVESDKTHTGTCISLINFIEEYKKQSPYSITEIGREIITHFQLYFIQKKEPQITLRNQDKSEVNLTHLFNNEFEKQILQKEFCVNDTKFIIYISKSLKAKSHKIHFALTKDQLGKKAFQNL